MKLSFLIKILLGNLGFLFLFAQIYGICTPDFSNANFVTTSGLVKLKDSNGINVIHNNLSLNPLSIVLEKIETDDNCFIQDSYVLMLSGTATPASDFQKNQLPDGSFQYLWNFDLSSFQTVLANQYQDFQFVNSVDTSISKLLSVRVDLQNPSLDFSRIYKGTQSYDLNNIQSNSNFKTGDILTLEFLGNDDFTVQDVRLESIQGGINQESTSTLEFLEGFYLSRINLTNSPFIGSFKITDSFGRTNSLSINFSFDSNVPEINSLDITSYQLEGENQFFYADLFLKDDFEILQNDVDVYLIEQVGQTRLNIFVESCTSNKENNSVMYNTHCILRSDSFQAQESFDSIFNLRVVDKVGNEVLKEIPKNIFIDSTAPIIQTFELINSVNQKNIISSNSDNISQIKLVFNSQTPELYEQATFSNGISGVNSQVIPSFGPLESAQGDCVKDESSSNDICIWNVSSNLASQLSSTFNISIVVVDVAGNYATKEIEIIVDNTPPKLVDFKIMERGNERNNLLESYERVRIEIFLDDTRENEEIYALTNGSLLIFKDSIEDLDFYCDYDLELEKHICYSDDFLLNKGFDGNDTELLNVQINDKAGNKIQDSKVVKIYKISDEESIDYFKLKSSSLLSSINRRIISQEGMDIYHFFELEEKDNSNRFEIVSIELLGQLGAEEGVDIRLQNFELQNETSQGTVLGNNRIFYLKSYMPKLLSYYETQESTQSEISISIIKVDEDTVYKLENLSIPLPIQFYDMPRGVNSNVALAEKLLDDISGIDESRRSGEGLLDIYMSYYNLCNAVLGVQGAVQKISGAWFTISGSFGTAAPGITAPIDASNGLAQTGISTLLNSEGIIGKVCMLATCEMSQKLIGGQINSLTNTEIGSYITGQKTVLGNYACGVRE